MMAQHLQSVVGVRVKEDEEGAGRSQNLKSQISVLLQNFNMFRTLTNGGSVCPEKLPMRGEERLGIFFGKFLKLT